MRPASYERVFLIFLPPLLPMELLSHLPPLSTEYVVRKNEDLMWVYAVHRWIIEGEVQEDVQLMLPRTPVLEAMQTIRQRFPEALHQVDEKEHITETLPLDANECIPEPVGALSR